MPAFNLSLLIRVKSKAKFIFSAVCISFYSRFAERNNKKTGSFSDTSYHETSQDRMLYASGVSADSHITNSLCYRILVIDDRK